MEQENQQQVQQEPQQEPQQVTTKNPKKVEAGKRLVAHNRRKREELKTKREEQEQKTGELSQYYGIGAVIALGVIGGAGYYIYRFKEKEIMMPVSQPSPCPRVSLLAARYAPSGPQTNKFEID